MNECLKQKQDGAKRVDACNGYARHKERKQTVHGRGYCEPVIINRSRVASQMENEGSTCGSEKREREATTHVPYHMHTTQYEQGAVESDVKK